MREDGAKRRPQCGVPSAKRGGRGRAGLARRSRALDVLMSAEQLRFGPVAVEIPSLEDDTPGT
ncbi:hypothetical protein GCM10009657_13040 [Oryzihumus leptocrescens]